MWLKVVPFKVPHSARLGAEMLTVSQRAFMKLKFSRSDQKTLVGASTLV